MYVFVVAAQIFVVAGLWLGHGALNVEGHKMRLAQEHIALSAPRCHPVLPVSRGGWAVLAFLLNRNSFAVQVLVRRDELVLHEQLRVLQDAAVSSARPC